ncbi:MAG TPA: DUF3105 domain-containing protein [Solirubrobacteraceae bacterium]
MPRLIERLLIVAVSLAISIGVIALLSGGLLAGRDTPGISGTDTGPGIAFRDQGDMRLRPGDFAPVYDSSPPTSGPHIPAAVVDNGATLTNDQLLQSLQVGDVVLMYGSRRPPAGVTALAGSLAPPFTPALAASGGAVILARRSGIAGVIGLAWAHMQRVATAADPALRTFAQFWLGRGATSVLPTS